MICKHSKILISVYLLYLLILGVWAFLGPSVDGAVIINHASGITTYTTPNQIRAGDSVVVSDGEATLQNTFKGGSILTLSDPGTAIIDGSFGGAVQATGGTLLLGANQAIKNADFIVNGTTINTNGESFNLGVFTLNGSSTIDLAGTLDNTIDFGTFTNNSFRLDFINWQSTDVITFSNPLPASPMVYIDGTPAVFTLQGNSWVMANPSVSEPSIVVTAVGFLLVIGIHRVVKK